MKTQKDLNKKDTARLIIDFWHRTIMHYSLWFSEVQHQFGRDAALRTMQEALKRSYGVQMKRLAGVLDFDMDEGIPGPLAALPDDRLEDLKNAVAVNWLANDGVWFQALEFSRGMNDAKRCNDSTWAQFSPFEAWSIKRFLGLPEATGLEGLKRALNFRLYAAVNTQSAEDDTPDSFIFRMNECRVQRARKRKGLEDYPCKSGGLVEYSTFAEAIDPRIKTECIGCPPDPHPDEWYCAWRFSIGS
jgi:hypothetical protein